jgi:hypothetical protein
MLKGYPIGYIMLWQSPKIIRLSTILVRTTKLIFSQTILSLTAAEIDGTVGGDIRIKVKDKNYVKRQIRIAFNPLTREFVVWTEAYERNPEWINGISAVFAADANHDASKFRRSLSRNVMRSSEEWKAILQMTRKKPSKRT